MTSPTPLDQLESPALCRLRTGRVRSRLSELRAALSDPERDSLLELLLRSADAPVPV